jgi:hypothetical protein
VSMSRLARSHDFGLASIGLSQQYVLADCSIEESR